MEEEPILFQNILFRIGILPGKGDLDQTVRKKFGLLPRKIPGIAANGEFLFKNPFVSVRFDFIHAGPPGAERMPCGFSGLLVGERKDIGRFRERASAFRNHPDTAQYYVSDRRNMALILPRP